jgi:hypothetical protein
VANKERAPMTEDGHFVVISGRRWRATDPAIPEDEAAQQRWERGLRDLSPVRATQECPPCGDDSGATNP